MCRSLRTCINRLEHQMIANALRCNNEERAKRSINGRQEEHSAHNAIGFNYSTSRKCCAVPLGIIVIIKEQMHRQRQTADRRDLKS